MAAIGLVFLNGVGYDVTTRTDVDPGVGVTVATPAAPVEPPPSLAVIGDSFSSVDWSPGGASAGWPAQVAARLDLEHVNLARGGAGYVRASATAFTYAATQVPAGTDVVVVFGGYNDQGVTVTDVEMHAAATFATVRLAAPGAELVVVGPQWPHTTPPPAAYLDLRDRVRGAALARGAAWVDPTAERWFADRPHLIGGDGIHPNGLGQAFLADRIEPHVADALRR